MKRYDLFYAFGERLWFTACVPEVMYRNAIIRHRIHHFVVITQPLRFDIFWANGIIEVLLYQCSAFAR